MSMEKQSNNVSGKPEAIVRPLRRRENSQESGKYSDQQSIFYEKSNKENIKESLKKVQPRRAILRESKKNSRDVSTQTVRRG